MTFVHEFAKDAKEAWANYQPGLTEAIGLLEVGTGLMFFSVFSACLIFNRSDRIKEPLGVIVPSKLMAASTYVAAQGIVKLAIPILAGTSYYVYKSYY